MEIVEYRIIERSSKPPRPEVNILWDVRIIIAFTEAFFDKKWKIVEYRIIERSSKPPRPEVNILWDLGIIIAFTEAFFDKKMEMMCNIELSSEARSPLDRRLIFFGIWGL